MYNYAVGCCRDSCKECINEIIKFLSQLNERTIPSFHQWNGWIDCVMLLVLTNGRTLFMRRLGRRFARCVLPRLPTSLLPLPSFPLSPSLPVVLLGLSNCNNHATMLCCMQCGWCRLMWCLHSDIYCMRCFVFPADSACALWHSLALRLNSLAVWQRGVGNMIARHDTSGQRWQSEMALGLLSLSRLCFIFHPPFSALFVLTIKPMTCMRHVTELRFDCLLVRDNTVSLWLFPHTVQNIDGR